MLQSYSESLQIGKRKFKIDLFFPSNFQCEKNSSSVRAFAQGSRTGICVYFETEKDHLFRAGLVSISGEGADFPSSILEEREMIESLRSPADGTIVRAVVFEVTLEDQEDDDENDLYSIYTILSAGMPPAVHVNHSQFTLPARGGIPVGIASSEAYRRQKMEWTPGSLIYLHTELPETGWLLRDFHTLLTSENPSARLPENMGLICLEYTK